MKKKKRTHTRSNLTKLPSDFQCDNSFSLTYFVVVVAAAAMFVDWPALPLSKKRSIS